MAFLTMMTRSFRKMIERVTVVDAETIRVKFQYSRFGD